MASTFFGLNIAASGMNTYNAALNTTAHNIANTNTKGYTKQSIIRQAKDAISMGNSYGMMGAGVNALDIISSRDEYYDNKFRISNTNYGKYDTLAHYMTSIETYMYTADSESGGLTNALDKFFTSLDGLTENVSDVTSRGQSIGYADNLATYVGEMATGLYKMQQEINTEIDSTVDKINSYAMQLASLTKQINTLEVYGTTANDLRDQRANILDKLSGLVDISVEEKAPADGDGVNQFVVTMGGSVLVDTYNYNSITLQSSTTKDNQNDAEGLYTLKWSNGQEFNIRNANLGGQLQALFLLRDGNNGDNFKASLSDYSTEDGTITLTAAPGSAAADLSKLNIPESKGVLTVANYTFAYDSFSVSVAEDGTYTYTFKTSDDITEGKASHLDAALEENRMGTVGSEVDYRGIPYYMAQLNEFVRTTSANFNEIQNTGYDLYGNLGEDLFVSFNKATGEEFQMEEMLYKEKEGYYYRNGCKVLNADAVSTLEGEGYTLQAVEGEDGYFQLLDGEGKVQEKVYCPTSTEIFQFSSLETGGAKTSYYSMTAMNFAISSALESDGKKLACASDNPMTTSGVSEGGNLDRMVALRENNTIFKQGTPANFLAVLVATAGVDGSKVNDSAENAKNILNAVDNRRMSKSGVDEDEEAQDLITFQNLLKYQYQVLSVMNEVLDKLINGTAV